MGERIPVPVTQLPFEIRKGLWFCAPSLRMVCPETTRMNCRGKYTTSCRAARRWSAPLERCRAEEKGAGTQTCTGDARLFRPPLYYLSYPGVA